MKNFSRLTTSALTLAALAASSAAYAVSEQGNAAAVIVAPISITSGDDLEFGSISTPTVTSTVSVDTNNGATATPGIGHSVLLATGNTPASGTFTVAAIAGETLTIGVSGATTQPGIVLQNFDVEYNGNVLTNVDGTAATGVTSVASDTVEVGASLVIDPANVTSGPQSFTYNLDVSYE